VFEACIFAALKEALTKFPELFLILAPHEPVEEYLKNAEKHFAGVQLVRWSNISSAPEGFRILLIDSVGILAGLYHSAKMVYVGGAFTTGVHNILEPVAMGASVAFGPKHDNSTEALQLLEQNLVNTVKNSAEFRKLLFDLLADQEQSKTNLSSVMERTTRLLPLGIQ
jgi:3-deoxy-D-manno-octulosonic-acid transferase